MIQNIHTEKTKTIIFTDLDGTLLDGRTYSYQEAMPALELIRKKDIALVFCSSKTRPEVEIYRERLNIRDPFIVENGGAVYVPGGYFGFLTGKLTSIGEYIVSTFGKPYATIRSEFNRLREGAPAVKGFGDMTVEEISRLTGLPQDEAALAKQREFVEPFVFGDNAAEPYLAEIEASGLRLVQGRFHYLTGDHDKGCGVRLLKRWYKKEHGRIVTIGIGDGLNDVPLLQAVDYPVLVQKENGEYAPVDMHYLTKAKGIGPVGWNQAVLELLNR